MNERIDDEKSSNEYVALRSELLALHERAHDVWRWGLIAIVSVLGVVVATLIEIRKDLPDLLSTFWLYPVALMLYAFAAGIAIAMAKLSADIQGAMYRVGGYLAVVHDLQSAKLDRLAYTLGWHVWNRIDRFISGDGDQASTEGSGRLRYKYHGDPRVYIWVLGFFVFCVSALISATAKEVCFWFLVVSGIVVCGGVWYCLHSIEKRLREELIQWNDDGFDHVSSRTAR